MTQTIKVFHLDGKEFLDQLEAAHYMCLSLAKFRQLPEGTVTPLNNYGKIVYRKSELKEIIESQN
jgi:hypothetical protein